MDMALVFVTVCLEVFLVTRIVLLSKETRLAIIPSLNDVLGYPSRINQGFLGIFHLLVNLLPM